jgi:hypothetical protein
MARLYDGWNSKNMKENHPNGRVFNLFIFALFFSFSFNMAGMEQISSNIS